MSSVAACIAGFCFGFAYATDDHKVGTAALVTGWAAMALIIFGN